MSKKPPAPSFVASDREIPEPIEPKPVDGFRTTLARRGDRALTYDKPGWYGSFVYEVDGRGEARVVCASGLTTHAAYLDDDHIAVTAGDETWVFRRAASGYALVAGVEKASGPITPLVNDMLAVGHPDDGLKLLAFRGGCLRLFKGKVKLPADAPDYVWSMTVHDDRPFATSSGAAYELIDANLAADWDPSADWDKAVKKLIKSSGVPISVVEPPAPPATEDGVRVQADGSRWRLSDDTAAVEVDGQWRELALSEPPSGEHYPEVPERERRFLVDRRLHGAVDTATGTAWMTPAAEKLVRVDLATSACTVAASTPAWKQTIGIFPQPDGRVVVFGDEVMTTVTPGNDDVRRDDRGGTYAAAVSVGGPVIACVMVRPDLNKNGLPGAWLELREIWQWPRQWLSWQLPMHAPSLAFDGRTLIAYQGSRALAFDLEAALEWFPNWSGRTDAPALPPKPAKGKKVR